MMKKTACILAAFLLAGCAFGSSGRSVSEGKASPSASPATGKTVSFGTYQDQPISWYVLAEEDDRSLLLSVNALASMPFNDGPSTWDTSSLRTWLNDEFYQDAFTAEEQQKILLSSLENGDDLKYGTKTGQNTEDRVFLLSASEAQKYLRGKEKTTSPTAYASEQGAYTNEKGECAWWLRSPGVNDDGPAYYNSQGEIGTRAHAGSETIIGVRPALWIDTSSLIN